MRSVELERLYKESAKEIHEKLVSKLSGKGDGTTLGSGHDDEGHDFANAHGTPPPPSVYGRWLSSCLSGLVQSPSLRTYTKEFPRDIGLVLGIHRWIGHLMHHCDDGGDQD